MKVISTSDSKSSINSKLEKIADELRLARKGKKLQRGKTSWRKFIHEDHRD